MGHLANFKICRDFFVESSSLVACDEVHFNSGLDVMNLALPTRSWMIIENCELIATVS